MKQLVDLLPAVTFFACYFMTKDFMTATIALVIGSAVQLALTWAIWKKVEKMHIAIFCMLLPLAGLTLLFDDERFLMWKPTIVNWVFTLVLLGSHYIGERNLSQRAIEGMLHSIPEIKMDVPTTAWATVNRYVALFFFIIGALNLLVAFNFSEATWVTFKVFGLVVFNLIGVGLLFAYLYQFMQQAPQEPHERPTNTD